MAPEELLRLLTGDTLEELPVALASMAEERKALAWPRYDITTSTPT